MTFGEVIDGIGKNLVVELVDEGGAAAVQVDGNTIIFQAADDDLVLLHADLGEIAPENRDRVLAAAMEANWLYEGTGGGTLAVNPADGRLHLEKYTWFDRLVPDDTLSMIERFVATVETWRKILSDYHGAPPVIEPGKISDLPYPPPGEFLQL